MSAERSPHKRLWFSPFGTEWEAESYEEALEMERDSLQEQLETEQGLRRSADAALEAVGGELERALSQQADLRERLTKLANWYGHDLDAALGSNPAKERP